MEERFVDTQQQLTELCDTLQRSDVIAIDTEFLREKTYYAQLCLVQVATDDVIACVDPLLITDLSPLLDLLYQNQRCKVLHSARQDLEIFFDLRGKVPKPVFDTQVAATLLGYGDQLGYAKLVKAMLGNTVDKEHARTDWSQRPLDDAQIHYAMNDVRYLIAMYRLQSQRLQERGREQWLAEDFDKLTDNKLYQPALEDLWRRVKGTRVLKQRQLAVLQQLAIWREQRARELNRPRKWIMSDDMMVDIARRGPTTVEALEKIRGWNNAIKKAAPEILDKVMLAGSLPEQQWPVAEHAPVLGAQQDAMVDLLMSVVRIRAMENDVTPAVLVTRKDLEHLVTQRGGAAVMTGWRYELVGKELLQCLSGEKTVTIRDGKVVVGDAT